MSFMDIDGELSGDDEIVLSVSTDERPRRRVKGAVPDEIEEEDEKNGMEVDSDEDALEDLEAQLDDMYEQFKERQQERDAKYKVKRMREKEEVFTGFSKIKDGDDDEDEDDEDDEEEGVVKGERQENWEDESDLDSDEEEIEEETGKGARPDGKKNTLTFAKGAKNPLLVGLDYEAEEMKKVTKSGLTKKAALFFDQPLFKGIKGLEENDEEEEVEDANEQMQEEMAMVKNAKMANGEVPNGKVISGKETKGRLADAKEMVNNKKRKAETVS